VSTCRRRSAATPHCSCGHRRNRGGEACDMVELCAVARRGSDGGRARPQSGVPGDARRLDRSRRGAHPYAERRAGRAGDGAQREDTARARAGRRGASRSWLQPDRDRQRSRPGINDLSAALRRRFNTVVLPLPADPEEEIAIVQRRVAEMGVALRLPKVPRPTRRSAVSSRCSASCAAARRRTAASA
jgi:hypothetical protein